MQRLQSGHPRALETALVFRPMADDKGVRMAVVDDEPAVRACVLSAYAKYVGRIGRRPAPMLADYRAAIRREEVFVLGEPISGLVVLVPAGDHVFLENVAVLPSLQGRGFGRCLMRFAERRTRELGFQEIRLYTGDCMWENRRMYPKLGYVEVGRKVDDGYPRVFFTKELE